MKLSFLGGAQTVTGSKTLVEVGQKKVLIDCGLFQGLKELRLKNWEDLSIEASTLDAVILTHAHLDHSGYLPALYRAGFRGKVFCSAPTRELAQLILLDSAHLLEEDADFANRHGFSKHRPAKPLYDIAAVKKTLDLFQAVRPGKWFDLGDTLSFRLEPSGHILGSTFVELRAEGKRVVFSGDLGRASPILYDPPKKLAEADVLVVEATYGDRNHEDERGSIEKKLAQVVQETYARGGQLIIPSFSVGRVQELLYLLTILKQRGALPDLPVYLDSPMGIKATRIFTEFPEWHRLDRGEVDRLCELTQAVESRVESIRIMREARPAIIIAGSGMVTGGRVLHHLTARMGDPASTILLVGFQAAGTRGRLLREGASELKMHGRYFPVHCQVETLEGLSAHADQGELLRWMRNFSRPPGQVFLNHGEPQALDVLRRKVKDELGWACRIPHLGETYEIPGV